MISSDIIIVGGGPGGLATAIEARLQGLTVTLFDKRVPPIDQACGEGLMPDCVESLHRWGVEIPWSERYPFRGIRYLQGDLQVEASFPDLDGLGVRRTTLHGAMAQRAKDLGVDLHWREKVLEYQSRGIVTPKGRHESRWVVAADGRRSSLRAVFSPKVKEADRIRFGVRRHYEVEPWTDFVEVYWRGNRQAYVTPVGPKLVGIALMWSGEPSDFDHLLDQFPRLKKRLDRRQILSKDRGGGPFGSRALTVAKEHFALVGDAAGSLDPISGYGLGLGFQEARAVVGAMVEENLPSYQGESERIRRTPRAMTRLLLLLDQNPGLRRRVLGALKKNPSLFDHLLSIHVGLTLSFFLKTMGLESDDLGNSPFMRGFLGVAFLLLAGLALWPLRSLEVDNRLESWIETQPEEEERYRRFQETFGSDEFLTVTLYGEDIFSQELFDQLLTTVEKLEELPGVVGVEGLPVLYRDLFEGEDLEELKREALSTPFYRGALVSENERALNLLISVKPTERPQARRKLVEGVRSVIAPLEEAGWGADLVGSPALIVALDRLSEAEVKRTFPLAFMVSLGILLLLFRSWRAMVIAALCAMVSVILSLALLQLAGRGLNMITSVLPPLIWVLALAGVVHILRRYQVHRDTCSRLESRRRALRETTGPCFLAAMTTALGFFSLLASVMVPVRELGLFAGIGILIALGVNLCVAPTLLRIWDLSARRETEAMKHPGFLFLGADRPRAVLGVALVLGFLGIFLLPGIVVESNSLLFLPEEHRTFQDYERVASTLGGFYTLEVILHLPRPWTDPSSWEAVDDLATKLEEASPVAHVISPLNLLRQLNYWEEGFVREAYRLPLSREDAESQLALLPESFENRLRALVSEDGHTLRLSAVVNEMNQESISSPGGPSSGVDGRSTQWPSGGGDGSSVALGADSTKTGVFSDSQLELGGFGHLHHPRSRATLPSTTPSLRLAQPPTRLGSLWSHEFSQDSPRCGHGHGGQYRPGNRRGRYGSFTGCHRPRAERGKARNGPYPDGSASHRECPVDHHRRRGEWFHRPLLLLLSPPEIFRSPLHGGIGHRPASGSLASAGPTWGQSRKES